MKYLNLFFYLLSILISNSVYSQGPEESGLLFTVVEERVESGFLLNKSTWDVESECDYQFVDVDQNCNDFENTLAGWINLYDNLQSAEILESAPFPLPQPEVIFERKSLDLVPIADDTSVEVPIGLTFLDVNYIPEDSIALYIDTITSAFSRFAVVSPSAPLEKGLIYSASPLRSFICSQSVKYRIDPQYFFSNRMRSITELRIDFGDGEGFRTLLPRESVYTVEYNTLGTTAITTQIVTPDGIFSSSSEIVIYPELTATNRDTLVVATSAGDTSRAVVDTYLGCDGKLDKPIFIVGGFSILGPYNPKSLARKYLDAEVFAPLSEAGYDFIMVGFSDTHLSAKVNAQSLKQLLMQTNLLKEGDYDNLIIGESMGGIVTRIALVEMEESGVDHECRLYISFDSPHGGANTPLGIQELLYDGVNLRTGGIAGFLSGLVTGLLNGLLNRLEDLTGLPGIQVEDYVRNRTLSEVNSEISSRYEEGSLRELVKSNNSQFSRESSIRINRFGSVLIPDIFNPVHQGFGQYLNEVGFPINSRNVALFNGSNAAMSQTNTAGDTLIPGNDLFREDADRNVEVYVKVSPVNRNRFRVSRIHRTKNRALLDFDEEGRFDFPSQPFDIAPGSYAFGGIRYTFIPTASAIALKYERMYDFGGLYYFNDGVDDLSRTRRGLVESSLTPFDDLYGQRFNTKHIDLEQISHVRETLLEREVMVDFFDLQNRYLSNGEARSFHGVRLLAVGENVNHWPSIPDGKIINPGTVEVENGATVKLTSNNCINLAPGFIAHAGSKVHAFIVEPQISCFEEANIAIELSEGPSLRALQREIKIEQIDTYFQVVEYGDKKIVSDNFTWKIYGMGLQRKILGRKISITGLPKGKYTVLCYTPNGKSSKTMVYTVKSSSAIEEDIENNVIEDVLESPDFYIYPNPADGVITWSDKKNYDVEVVDLSGRRVHSAYSVSECNLMDLNPGSYILYFSPVATGGNYQKRLLVIK